MKLPPLDPPDPDRVKNILPGKPSEKKAMAFLLPTINRIFAIMSTDNKLDIKQQLTQAEADEDGKSHSFTFRFKSDCFRSACALISKNTETVFNPFILALYYFATHPQIDLDTGVLTDADKEELLALLHRYETFVNDPKYETSWDAIADFITAENPPDAQEIIEQFNNSHLAKTLVIPNNKLANVITDDVIDIGEFVMNVARRNAKKRIDVTCILTDESDSKVKLTGRQRFTEYDRNVYNAVSSLYVYGDESHLMTPAMIYRMMTGMSEAEKPTAAQIESVTRSIDKMRFIRAQIDCTEEWRANGVTLFGEQIKNGKADTYLLAASNRDINTGGHAVMAYWIMELPILYEYASSVKQVLTVPAATVNIKILDGNGKITTRTLPNTERRILIKGYLIRRIEGMKGRNNLNSRNIALYDYKKKGEPHQGLYSTVGTPNPTRTEANRIRDDAEKMLDFWKAIKYIHDYKTITTGNKITGYEIILKPQKSAEPAEACNN